jgi:hypothetical protein
MWTFHKSRQHIGSHGKAVIGEGGGHGTLLRRF